MTDYINKQKDQGKKSSDQKNQRLEKIVEMCDKLEQNGVKIFGSASYQEAVRYVVFKLDDAFYVRFEEPGQYGSIEKTLDETKTRMKTEIICTGAACGIDDEKGYGMALSTLIDEMDLANKTGKFDIDAVKQKLHRENVVLGYDVVMYIHPIKGRDSHD